MASQTIITTHGEPHRDAVRTVPRGALRLSRPGHSRQGQRTCRSARRHAGRHGPAASRELVTHELLADMPMAKDLHRHDARPHRAAGPRHRHGAEAGAPPGNSASMSESEAAAESRRWLRYASEDLEISGQMEPVAPGPRYACWFSQQAAEIGGDGGNRTARHCVRPTIHDRRAPAHSPPRWLARGTRAVISSRD